MPQDSSVKDYELFDVGEGVNVAVIGLTKEEAPELVFPGNLVADSMRLRYGTHVAFTNGDGILARLPSDYAPRDTSLRRPPAEYADGRRGSS